jgi:hypothetical protein
MLVREGTLLRELVPKNDGCRTAPAQSLAATNGDHDWTPLAPPVPKFPRTTVVDSIRRPEGLGSAERQHRNQ